MSVFRVSRGKRSSVVVQTNRLRLRLVPGRFRVSYEHDQPHIWILAGKLFLLTVYRRAYSPDGA
jgi:hypothetical protein